MRVVMGTHLWLFFLGSLETQKCARWWGGAEVAARRGRGGRKTRQRCRRTGEERTGRMRRLAIFITNAGSASDFSKNEPRTQSSCRPPSVRPSVRPRRQRFVTRRWRRWRVPAPKGAQQSHAGAQKRRGGKKRTWSCMSALLLLMRSSNGQRNQIPVVMSYISVGKNRGGQGVGGPSNSLIKPLKKQN